MNSLVSLTCFSFQGFYIVIGHCIARPKTDSSVVNRAIQWTAKEKLRHYQVNALSRSSLYEPFTNLASKISSTPSRSSFSQLAVVRKNVKTDSG